MAVRSLPGGMDEETRRFYEDHEFGEAVGFGDRPALIVIDLANAFTDPDAALGSNVDDVVDRTADLLEAFRRADYPRYFTTIAYDDPATDGGRFVEKVPALADLERGSDAVAIDDRVAPRDDERVVEKAYASAFFGTDLETALTVDGVDTLVLAGVSTSGCVRATAIDGLQHGYRVVVPEDAVGDRVAGPHRANLVDIDAKYGDVTTTEDVRSRIE